MKRIVIWVDCQDDNLEDLTNRLRKFFISKGIDYTIVEIAQLVKKDSQ